MPDDNIAINDEISIPLSDVQLTATLAGGPGGQNVNKVSTAIHLRFSIPECAALPETAKEKLLALSDKRVTADGVVVLKSQNHRSQEKNRADAIARLQTLIRDALVEQKPRKATRPGKRAVRKRLDDKSRRGQLKKTRGKIDYD